MQLSIGNKLGPYEITAFIGEGGMGEVYRGIDARLGRAVAIKVCGHEFSDRFEREARAISSLNHPHICTLYDVGPNYLVMEFVEGDTLARIIERGPIPLDKALLYAIQIVDAIAAAHAKGVIHRDLKPGNIIVTRNGIKVLDFGLAKFSAEQMPGASEASAVTRSITREGAILGTLHYMSPEQVEARNVDARSDIFSFGVVLYEMISGERPFTGDTQASIIAAVLKDQPPSISQRRPLTPRALERVLGKCLEKNPDDRRQSARDLKPTLELIDLDSSHSPNSNNGAQAPIMRPVRRRWPWQAATAVAVIAAVAMTWTLWPKPQPAARVTRFEVALPQDAQVSNAFYVRVSPDGSKLAFTTVGEKSGIWVHDLESPPSRLLEGTEGASAPFWSPNSRSLAFGSGNRLMRVDIAGGPPRELCVSTTPVGSGLWTPQGEIVFGGRGEGPLQRVSEGGGVPAPLTNLAKGEGFHTLPSLLPDGRHFLYFRQGSSVRGLFAGSLDAKPDEQSLQQVMPAKFGATFAKSSNAAGGYLFYVRDGTLMAHPFDSKAMRLTGEPVPVVQQIGVGPSHAHFSVTTGGVMAYRTGPGDKVQLVWLDRQGNAKEKIGAPGYPVSVSLSPDQKHVAIVRRDSSPNAGEETANGDIWILDLRRNIETQFTTGQSVKVVADYGPVWSPDGTQLAYASGNGVYVKDAGGAADAKLIKEVEGQPRVTDWTRDSRFLILTVTGAHADDIVALAIEGSGDATPVLATPDSEASGRLSRDNHWIAYRSMKSGRSQVFVRPFAAQGANPAAAGPMIQLSRDGGSGPKWRPDGKELFFRAWADDALMSVEIEVSNTAFRPLGPVELRPEIRGRIWATSDGQRFLVAEPLDRGLQTPITVVTNWEATLKQ